MKTTRTGSNQAFQKLQPPAAQKNVIPNRQGTTSAPNRTAQAFLQDGFEAAPKASFASYAQVGQKEVFASGGTTDIHTSDSGAILDAPIKGDPSHPNPDTYNAVIDQFDVETNPRYAKNHQG